MKKAKQNISILGSTGSIGLQTLNVISCNQDEYEIRYLTANCNIEVLEKQALEFKPKAVVISDESQCNEFKKSTNFKGKVIAGEEGLIEAATDSETDIVLSALVGFAGVIPTLEAVKKGKTIALANKETLVSAGEIITKAAKENNSKIIAVDSEHSAILQCIVGEQKDAIEKIILTASGGPFRNTAIEDFNKITVDDALKHPNWSMGNKITIDSATMMNKGFEFIEAHWLFDLKPEQIEIVVHPQSIIHSFVQFVDGSVKAQLGLPDMRLPIAFALSYPERKKFDFPRIDFNSISSLTFEKPNLDKFPAISYAYEALKNGGIMPAVLNAANEIAVANFLKGKILFIEIQKYVEIALAKITNIINPLINDIINADLETRQFVTSIIANKGK